MANMKPTKKELDEGWITEEALEVVDRLQPAEVRRLAAMAVTFHKSGWGDRARILREGLKAFFTK